MIWKERQNDMKKKPADDHLGGQALIHHRKRGRKDLGKTGE
jgi:hypothetical protein